MGFGTFLGYKVYKVGDAICQGGAITTLSENLTLQNDLIVNGVVYTNSGLTVSADKLLKLTANLTAITCDGTNIGSIMFSSDNKHYGCNGISWNALY